MEGQKISRIPMHAKKDKEEVNGSLKIMDLYIVHVAQEMTL